MRVVIVISPAARPRAQARIEPVQGILGADNCGGANAAWPDVGLAAADRECGFAGSERRTGKPGLLTARRRLVCVCGDDNSRRNARADRVGNGFHCRNGVRPSRADPGGAPRLKRNSAHHHGINLQVRVSEHICFFIPADGFPSAGHSP